MAIVDENIATSMFGELNPSVTLYAKTHESCMAFGEDSKLHKSGIK
jgi:hypothetical protein